MRDFTVFVDEMADARTSASSYYMVALRPSGRRGAMATKSYFTREGLVDDLQQRLHYTAGAVERFFAEGGHQSWWRCPLSGEDALSLGWLPDFDHN